MKLFDPKPLQIASLLRFRKSREFSGKVNGEIFRDIAILKFFFLGGGPKRLPPGSMRVKIIYGNIHIQVYT